MHKTQIKHKKNICRTFTRETFRLAFSHISYWGKWTIAFSKVFDGRFSSERRGINPQHYVNFDANVWVELVTCKRTEDEWCVSILCHVRIVNLNSANPAQQCLVVTLIHCQNKVQLSRIPIYPPILLWVWVATHRQHMHTHTHILRCLPQC